MNIERKQISVCEVIFYFIDPLPINGVFVADEGVEAIHSFYDEMADIGYEELVLSADFLYLKVRNAEDLENAELVLLGCADEYLSQSEQQFVADRERLPEKISAVLKLVVAPFLQKDGGNIELVKYQDGVVYVRFLGKCNGCPYALKTLKERVEKNLVRYVSEVREAKLL